MANALTRDNVELIAETLGVPAQLSDKSVRFELSHDGTARTLTVEVHFALEVPDELKSVATGALVSVYGTNSFLQLHRCSGFITSKELGEVIFFAREAGITNGLVVEREAACSLHANVDERLLSVDFMSLPAELVMSTVALSLTDTLFDDLG
ncbi:MAG: hypothetical protein HKN13_14990 [Rhodothermales bacterium]|nr:hypothetical protein [Rhodothermales bacterium]